MQIHYLNHYKTKHLTALYKIELKYEGLYT